MTDMADVLAELDAHKPTHSEYTGGWWELACTGCDFAEGRRLSHLDWTPHHAHRAEIFAAALSAAGFGPVQDSDSILAILDAAGVPKADQFDGLVAVQKLAEAWDEGYNAGDYQRPANNPYREAQYLDAPLYSPSKAQLKAEDHCDGS